MLMRFDPFRDLEREFDRFRAPAGFPRVAAMPMDAFRRGDRFIVAFDLPGVDPASIDLTVEKNVLTVAAERTWPRDEGDEVIVAERPQGKFTRQLFLGETLDTDHLAANYEGGVLTITVPVAERAKARRIEVTTSGGDGTAIDTTSHETSGTSGAPTAA